MVYDATADEGWNKEIFPTLKHKLHARLIDFHEIFSSDYYH